jgi:hypothetical protein
LARADIVAAPGSGAAVVRLSGAAPAILAEFFDYPSLVAALRLAREHRNISFETLDELAGISKGQASKILAPGGSRRVTFQSLEWLLGGLACRCQIVSDDAALTKINGRMKPRNAHLARDGAVTIVLSRRWFRKIGRKGAAVTNARRKRRSEIGRKAALMRWHGNGNDK